MASNTGCMSADEREITRSTSAAAFSRSSASSRSRVRRAIFVSSGGVVERRPGTALGVVRRRFGVAALWRADLLPLPPAFERRLIALPRTGQDILAALATVPEVGSTRRSKNWLLDFRSGSDSDFRGRPGHFRSSLNRSTTYLRLGVPRRTIPGEDDDHAAFFRRRGSLASAYFVPVTRLVDMIT